ncbi:MAG: hypothetical protein RL077_1174 [Verrucomicrobiota bacterium]
MKLLPPLRFVVSPFSILSSLLLAGAVFAQSAPPPAGATREEELIRLSVFTVSTEKQSGYLGSYATGATRTGTSIFDTPQSINVITKDLYEDLQAFETQDAVRYLANVQPRVNTRAWRIRGYFVAQNFKNGFKIANDTTGDAANIERVEVIKGTNAVVLGQVDPSGSVNRVTKQPLFGSTLHKTNITAGSYDYYRGHLDLGGPMGSSGRLGYRLNVSYTSDGHFQEHDGPGGKDLKFEKLIVAPSFGWKIDEATDVFLNIEYGKERAYRPIFTVIEVDAQKNPVFVISPKRSPNHNWSFGHIESVNLQAYVIRRFGRDWTFRQMFNVTDARANLLFTTNIGRQLTARPRDHNNDWVLEGDLVGVLPLGVLKNQFLLGYNYGRDDNYSLVRRRNIPGIDYKNPNYNTVAPDLATIPILSSVDTDKKNGSVFAQDQVSFLDDKAKLLLGFRYERLEAGSTNRGIRQTGTKDGVFAPRVGVLYQPSRRLSFFGLYSSSEAPQRVTRPNGTVIDDPIQGDTVEVGVKSYLLDGRVGVTFSWFQIERTNITNGVTINGVDTIEPSGLEEAKGFELELAGHLTDQWQLVFNGATSRTADHSSFLVHPGSPLGGATDLKLALWNIYHFGRAEHRGWEVGGGWIFQSKMHGEDATYTLPASHIFEARMGYAWKRAKVALNVENVFDSRWFVDAPADKLTLPGTPRRARVTLSYEW